MLIPPINGSHAPSSEVCCHCLPSCLLWVLLLDLFLQAYEIPLSNKPLVSLPLSLGSFFGLEAGQLRGLQAFGVQPNNWQTSCKAEETLMSAKMLGNKNGEGKVVGVTPPTSIWDPVAADHHKRCLSLILMVHY